MTKDGGDGAHLLVLRSTAAVEPRFKCAPVRIRTSTVLEHDDTRQAVLVQARVLAESMLQQQTARTIRVKSAPCSLLVLYCT